MIKHYIITLPILVLFDYFWLGIISKNFYGNHLKNFIGDKFLLAPAIIFYLIYAFGLVVFVINPALQASSISKALLSGAFLGLIAYSTYNLVNLSTLSGWPIKVVIIDTLWGMFVSGAVSVIVFKISAFI